MVAIADLDAETALQLLDVVIEGAAQAGQTVAVGRLQVQIQGAYGSAQGIP